MGFNGWFNLGSHCWKKGFPKSFPDSDSVETADCLGDYMPDMEVFRTSQFRACMYLYDSNWFYMYLYDPIYVYLRVSMCIYVSVYVQMYYICICIYIYIASLISHCWHGCNTHCDTPNLAVFWWVAYTKRCRSRSLLLFSWPRFGSGPSWLATYVLYT